VRKLERKTQILYEAVPSVRWSQTGWTRGIKEDEMQVFDALKERKP